MPSGPHLAAGGGGSGNGSAAAAASASAAAGVGAASAGAAATAVLNNLASALAGGQGGGGGGSAACTPGAHSSSPAMGAPPGGSAAASAAAVAAAAADLAAVSALVEPLFGGGIGSASLTPRSSVTSLQQIPGSSTTGGAAAGANGSAGGAMDNLLALLGGSGRGSPLSQSFTSGTTNRVRGWPALHSECWPPVPLLWGGAPSLASAPAAARRPRALVAGPSGAGVRACCRRVRAAQDKHPAYSRAPTRLAPSKLRVGSSNADYLQPGATAAAAAAVVAVAAGVGQQLPAAPAAGGAQVRRCDQMACGRVHACIPWWLGACIPW